MASRPGVLATVAIPADGGEPPRAYAPSITAEVRCHWPPRAPRGDIEAAIRQAAERAIRDVEERYGRP